MKIDAKHAGLRRLVEDGDDSDIPVELRRRVRVILGVLWDAENPREIRGLPGWYVRRRDRNEWRIDVWGDWRITFRVEEDQIFALDLENKP